MLARFRSATRAQHARLERATGLLPHLSLDRYRLGPSEDAVFLVGHGPRTQALWNEAIERKRTFADEQPQPIGSVIESAGLCFDRLRAFVEENG